MRFLTDDVITCGFYEFVDCNDGKKHDFIAATPRGGRSRLRGSSTRRPGARRERPTGAGDPPRAHRRHGGPPRGAAGQAQITDVVVEKEIGV